MYHFAGAMDRVVTPPNRYFTYAATYSLSKRLIPYHYLSHLVHMSHRSLTIATGTSSALAIYHSSIPSISSRGCGRGEREESSEGMNAEQVVAKNGNGTMTSAPSRSSDKEAADAAEAVAGRW